MPDSVPMQAERLTFEEWARQNGYALERDEFFPDEYYYSGTNTAWQAWLFRAGL